jgi:membrane-associated phospholipid phosphatase
MLIAFVGTAQTKDTLIKKLDSLSIQQDSLNNGKNNNIDPSAYNEITKLNSKTYFTLLGSNLKQQATLPFHTKRKDWAKLGKFTLLTAGVYALNKPINRYASNLRENNPGVASVSKFVTNFGGIYEVYTLAAFYTYGLIFKTQKEKTTTLLATQAYITGGAVGMLVKFLSGEQRPDYIDPKTGKNSPTFHGPFIRFKKNAEGAKIDRKAYSSFPSGHTTAAFAAATVFAMEYRDKPLIPIISYSAASLIGLSRITQNRHWASDVLVGAALGFLSGKQIVNNYHRYSKLKQPNKEGQGVTFNVQSLNGRLMPGLTYNF